jgi:hypothetical protein
MNINCLYITLYYVRCQRKTQSTCITAAQGGQLKGKLTILFKQLIKVRVCLRAIYGCKIRKKLEMGNGHAWGKVFEEREKSGLYLQKSASCHRGLREQCHEIFDFKSFSWISFPQAHEYPIRAVWNFFKNLLRYVQLKVHHGGQMENTFNKKSLKYFFCSTLGSRVSIHINFFFKFTFSCKQTDCHWCEWHQWRIYRWSHWYWWQLASGINDTSGTRAKFTAGVVVIRNDPNFIYRGLGEDYSWKNLNQKISLHCSCRIPIRHFFSQSRRLLTKIF